MEEIKVKIALYLDLIGLLALIGMVGVGGQPRPYHTYQSQQTFPDRCHSTEYATTSKYAHKYAHRLHAPLLAKAAESNARS
jgi:hypothetical protein